MPTCAATPRRDRTPGVGRAHWRSWSEPTPHRRGTMKFLETLLVIGCAALLPAAGRTQSTATPYPTMAPIDQYRMTPAAEIALAKRAAPEAISTVADILVLGTAGYDTPIKAPNGFVCLLEPSS